MSGSQLDSTASSNAMSSTAVSSTFAASLPPIRSLSATITPSSLAVLAQQQQQQQLDLPLSPHRAPFHHIDSTADDPLGSDRLYTQRSNCALLDAVHHAKAASKPMLHVAQQERRASDSDSSSSSPPATVARLASQSVDTTYSTLCVDHDDAAAYAKSSSSTARAATTSMHTVEARASRDGLPAQPTQDQSHSECNVDSAAAQARTKTPSDSTAVGTSNITSSTMTVRCSGIAADATTVPIIATQHSPSSLVNASSDASPTPTSMGSQAPYSPLKPTSISLQPEAGAKGTLNTTSRDSAEQPPSGDGGLTAMTTTSTATSTSTAANALPLPMPCPTIEEPKTLLPSLAEPLMFLPGDDSPQSNSAATSEAAAAPLAPRREKRRPPSLFAGLPMTATYSTVAIRPVLIPPAVGRLEDRSLTQPAAALMHPCAAQAMPPTSPPLQTSQLLPRQLQRLSAPPLRTSGWLSPLSGDLVSLTLPTNHDDAGGERDTSEGRLSTSVTRREMDGLIEAPPPMKLAIPAPAPVKQFAAFLPMTSPPLRFSRTTYPSGTQQPRAAYESQKSLSGSGFFTGDTSSSMAAHCSAVEATAPAAATPGSTPLSATVNHYGPLYTGYTSAAARSEDGGLGGIATLNTTPLVGYSTLGGFASRLQPPSAGRLQVTGMSGGVPAAARVLSPLSPAAAVAAPKARRCPPPPLLFRLRSPVGPASLNTIFSANDINGDVASPGSAAPCSTTSQAVNSATAAAATSAGASSSVLTTPPLNPRPMTITMNSGSTADLVSTMADQAARGGGCNPSAMPARWGPLPRPHHGSLHQNLNTFPLSTRSGSAGGPLVRISQDRRTLVAGLFRVSPDGCLTVRNMLLLNPTRIDAGSTTGRAGGPGTYESFMGSTADRTGTGGGGSLPLQLLHPQRSMTNYSPLSSNGGLAGRMQLLGPGGGLDLGGGGGVGGSAGGLGPMTPSTTVSDWYSPSPYHGGGGWTNRRNTLSNNGAGGGINTATNASFTLFSTSMDTPFSPIMYSMDSQQLALPSSLGGHYDRAGAAAGQPPQSLSAVREDIATSQFLSASGAPQQQPGQHQEFLHGAHHMTEATASPTRTLGFGVLSSGGTAATQQQVSPHNFTNAPGRPPGGGGGTTHHRQLRRQVSGGWLPGALAATSAASPPTFVSTDSPGSMLGTGALTDTDTVSTLLLPYMDIPAWRGGMAWATGGSCVGSPSVHVNPGGFRTTAAAAAATAATAAMMTSSGTTQATPCTSLPPNVVRLRDLDILSTTVGEGASAMVYVAIHKPTGRRLAVKRLDLSPLCLGCPSPYLRSGAVSNARIHQLQHIVVRELQVLHLTYRSPFMVKVYNAFFIAEMAALDIVMEFMHYGSLAHLADSLQKHARLTRDSQQQRHRLLTGDGDTDIDGDGEGGGHSSRCGSTSTAPLLCDTLEASQFADEPLKATLSTGVGRSDTSGSEQCPSAAFTSPKLLDSRRTFSGPIPSVALVPRKFSVTGTNGGSDSDSTADGSGVLNHHATLRYRHIYDANESLPLDSYSVESNYGTDDTESDDGSGLVEEPFGVTERLVAVVGEQLLRGVRDMHSRGYIHRDIKPGNVLVNEHGVVKLSDFGLSQRCDGSGIGIKNHMLSYVPPASIAATQSNTPLQSPAIQPTGARAHRTPFAGHAHRGSIGAAASGPFGSGVIGTTPPEMASSGEGLMLGATSSLLAQHDGMDVLEAESTSSEEGVVEWGATGRGRGGLSPSSSSSSDGAENCCGTQKYMSPERQRGEPYGKPADIWAVGVTLAEFAVGEHPYDLEDVIDEFDRVSRMEKPVDVLKFNRHRAVPLGTVFADFCRLATLPTASQRPTAQELLEHPFFKQWHRPFNLKDYLAARVPVPSNQLKEDYLAKQCKPSQEWPQPTRWSS
ncbi:Protein tyrosine kinase [Leishmania braziliensis]|nr:Protein tyrosine kinase [Leishmania braziliensis]